MLPIPKTARLVPSCSRFSKQWHFANTHLLSVCDAVNTFEKIEKPEMN
jgi:hypothetical protein